MSEPDNPRWLDEIGDELRQEVPVRAAWRARLLDDVARARRPVAGDDFDDRNDEPPVIPAASTETAAASPLRERRIVLHPLTGIAAAVVFIALGVGATLTALSWRTRTLADSSTANGTTPRPGTTLVSNASADREVVRFELSAPTAARVALVGSFNEWNPVATPLQRDSSTGKWIVSLRLPPGRHVYAFVVDGDVKADPTAPRAADDDFGSANSVVLVGGRTS
jgi:hypothetical protein